MKLCPVDLAGCSRPECGGGHCSLAESARLVVCWDCGVPEPHGVKSGVCITCMTLYREGRARRPALRSAPAGPSSRTTSGGR